MSNFVTSKYPANLSFLFPTAVDGECSDILYETAKNLVKEIDSVYTPDIDRSGPFRSVELLYQTPKRYLHIVIQQDGQVVTYQGENTTDTARIDGKGAITDDFSFLGNWLDNESTT